MVSLERRLRIDGRGGRRWPPVRHPHPISRDGSRPARLLGRADPPGSRKESSLKKNAFSGQAICVYSWVENCQRTVKLTIALSINMSWFSQY
eukprot:3107452-Pleurochrysis_carterae.AAC.1